ncbi:hypothetical protein FRC09_012934 [Ceratobasidium sp. 395]|nr:hypothetical protein FRC09_012934 [Ceratobasidium sp. 395]
MSGFEFLWGSNGDGLGGLPPLAFDGGTSLNVGQLLNHEGLTTQYPDYSNELTPIDTSPSGQFSKDAPTLGAHTIPDCYFVVLGNIYRRFGGGIVRLHQELSPPAPTTTAPNPLQSDSVFFVGILAFCFDILGQLYWIRELGDNSVELESVPTFNTEDEAWTSLGIIAKPAPSPGRGNPPGSPSSNIASPGSSGVSGSSVVWTPDLISSPNTSESCASDWIPASPGAQQPLFSSPGSGILTSDSIVGEEPPPTASPPPLPSPPEVIETRADVDKYFKWVKEQRRHRGAGASQTELICPVGGCGKPQRRPGVLRDHILSVHFGLRSKSSSLQLNHKPKLINLGPPPAYKCPHTNCPEWFPTDSNRHRHLNTCPFRNK